VGVGPIMMLGFDGAEHVQKKEGKLRGEV